MATQYTAAQITALIDTEFATRKAEVSVRSAQCLPRLGGCAYSFCPTSAESSGRIEHAKCRNRVRQC